MTRLLKTRMVKHLCSIVTIVLAGYSAAQEQKNQDLFGSDKKAGSPLDEDPLFHVHPAPDGRAYFPKGKASYYTLYLAAMKEPSIQEAEVKGEDFHFRFTWLRSFQDPVSVRLWSQQGKVQCHYVALAGKSQNSPRTPKDEQTLVLNQEQVRAMEALASAKEFWAPLNKQEEQMLGFDGAEWIFEWKDALGYRLSDIWTPSAHTPENYRNAFGDKAKHRDFSIYTKMGTFLLKLCKHLPKDANAIY
jgi:hypothetical protein